MKTLTQILDELSAILSSSEELETLPALRNLELRRDDPGARWSVKAYIGGINGFETAAEAIAAVKAYAAHGGSNILTHDEYPSTAQRSGTQVSLRTHIEVDGIPVQVSTILDGDEYARALAQESALQGAAA